MKTIPRIFSLFSLLLALLFLSACNEDLPPRARPHGFHKIAFPDTVTYRTFESATCPFEFDFPSLGQVSRELADSCWVDIHFPTYDLKWHLTHRYVPNTQRPVSDHYEEHRRLIYKHSKKATQIAARDFNTPTGSGSAWEVYGNVGTPAYYFLADSAQENIVMVSFYFNTALKNDSLAPVIDYMRGEMEKALLSLKWK